jgi:hypothetical protein
MDAWSIFSPRAVNGTHGTGVQIANFLETFRPNLKAFNFGIPEPFKGDQASHLESRLATAWPLRTIGRRFWFDLCQETGISFWSDNALTAKGRRAIDRLRGEVKNDRIMVVVANESDAKRWLAIAEIIRRPFDVILYDLVTSELPSPTSLPFLSAAILDAERVLTISPALSEVANSLGRCKTERIGFYRNAPTNFTSTGDNFAGAGNEALKVLVIAYAHPEAMSDLFEVADCLNRDAGRLVELHLVGGIAVPSRFSILPPWVRSYGRVSDLQRDQIASRCDVAYLAGPCLSITECPYSKYSIPSKMSDFLVAGLPILARVSIGSAVGTLLEKDLHEIASVAYDRHSLMKHLLIHVESIAELRRKKNLVLEQASRTVLLPAAALWIFDSPSNDRDPTVTEDRHQIEMKL